MHKFTLEDLKKALEIVNEQQKSPNKSPKPGEKDEEGRAQENMGNGYYSIGQYPNAIECYTKHLRIAEELRDNGGVGRAHANLGKAYGNIGQYANAIECYTKHLRIAEELGDNGAVGRAHSNLGKAYGKIGQYQKAFECHRKHLEIAEELGDKGGVGDAHANLGILYDGIGQYQKAIEYHRKHLEIAEEFGDKAAISLAHARLGIDYRFIGQYEKAIECHRKNLEITEELGDKASTAMAHTCLAIAYYDTGQYRKAIDCFRKTLEIAEEMGNKCEVGECHAFMGDVYGVIGLYQEAIECRRKQLHIAEELGDKAAVGRAHASLGNAYIDIGQYQFAIECHHKYLDIAEELGDKAGFGEAHAHLGNAYGNIGQYQNAIECHGKALEIAEELGDKGGVGTAHGDLGDAYINIGQYQKAIECYRKRLAISEELGDKTQIGRAHVDLGKAYHNIGQYENEIQCYRKNLVIAEQLGDKTGVGLALASLGNAYTVTDQYQIAIRCHRKHLSIAEELGNKNAVAIAIGCLGIAYDGIGQNENAFECHRKLLEIAEEQGDKAGVGRASKILGSAYRKIGQYEKAIEYHRKHLEIAEELGDKAGIAQADQDLGIVYYSTGQYQKALVLFHRSLEIVAEIGDIRAKVTYQRILGEFHKKDDECLSSSFFAQSILSFHSIRRYGIDEDEINTSLSNLSNDTHRRLFLSLLNLKQVKAALLISDAGKAKALFDLTKKYVDVVLDSALEENFIIPIQAISNGPSSKANEEFLYNVLSKVLNLTVQDGCIISYTFDDRDNLHAWVVSKEGVFHKEWQTVNGMSTKTYFKSINVATRDSFAQKIPKNISFLPNAYSYTFDTERKYKFTELALISGKDNRENNYARDLDERVENLMRSNNTREKPKCSDPNLLDVKSVKERYCLDSSSNNQCGIDDCSARNCKEKEKAGERCLGCYNLETPNAAQSRTRKENNYRGDPSNPDKHIDIMLKKQYSLFISPIEEYLVGSKILIAPEGSLFSVLFCALLNSKDEPLCEKYSLQFTPALHVLNASISKALPKLGQAFFVGNPKVGEVVFNGQVGSQVPLPDAAVEAKECSLIFNAEALLEKNATKENVLSGMKDASIIHIAAHGHMDEADIFLAPNKGAPKPPSEDHYLLTAKDVTKCTLVARLVVLSCCHSGRGEISAEGVVGIARSFLGAGARSVVVTLCEIPDGATKVLMKEFYDNILQGLSVCVALQRSMIELKKSFSIAAWAPFQIVGEDIALSNDEIQKIRHLSSIRYTETMTCVVFCVL